MKILGIDPGVATTGWGIIEVQNAKIKMKNGGCVLTSAKNDHSHRLAEIFSAIQEIIKKEKPDVAAIERLFFVNNVKTAMTVGEARGVCILAVQQAGLLIYEFTPLEIKQAVVGYGKAEKRQVQKMVQVILGLSSLPKPDDMADALACAICCANSLKLKKLKS